AWRLPVIAGELDLAVPDGRHPVERALEIALQGAAHGVELQPDAVERRDRARQRARARAAEARGERGGAEGVEEGAAVGRHGSKARGGLQGGRAVCLAVVWVFAGTRLGLQCTSL